MHGIEGPDIAQDNTTREDKGSDSHLSTVMHHALKVSVVGLVILVYLTQWRDDGANVREG
jgi:hypothetical protein